MNRKMRRELRKDKNLINELFSIINKYLPELFDKFDNLTDIRYKSYTKYSMKVICVTRLFGLICGLTSLSNVSSDEFDTENCIKNIGTICNTKLEELPYWETIQDVFMNIKIDELRDIQKYIVKTLLRSKMFDKYKYNGAFQLLFDGTGLSNHNYNLNGNCLQRKHKDGSISYYKYVLECKLVVGNIVISLDSEFIENSTMFSDKEKQDCEIKAFERMAERIKNNYPKQQFIITGDALYANNTTLNICKNNKWNYIFNLNKRLRTVLIDFNDYIECFNDTDIHNYFLDKSYKYKTHIFNIIKFVEKKKNKETYFHYITNLDASKYNIKDIVIMGRKRWKIENEGFYTQKHRTFNIGHLNSRNDNAMKAHYFFIQFAHTIRQLLEQGNLLTKSLKLKIKEVSAYLLKSLTSYITDLIDLVSDFQLRFVN